MSTAYQMAQGTFNFAGLQSENYGLWIEGGGTYAAPARKYNAYDVPGRNGAVTIDGGAYEEVEHTYRAFIARDFAENVQSFRNDIMALKGAQRLTDTYHPEEFYLARYMRGLEPEVAPRAVGGRFDVTFTRDPRRFLVSGETTSTVASGGSLTNPTNYAAKPLIRVYGYGDLLVNDERVTINSGFEYVDIDSEIMDCYHALDNANSRVTFQNRDFPELRSGVNSFSYSGNITSVQVTPRWWRL